MTIDTETRHWLGKHYRDQAFVQDYSTKPRIEGVRIIDLRLFVDDGGSFNELIRINSDQTLEALPEFRVRQSSYSEIVPGAVKAWHLHAQQDDLWFVPPSHRLLVGLLDVREQSPTYNVTMRFVMGGGAAKLVQIPAGVAHGAANLWQTPAAILYFVSSQFNLSEPDEMRLPWDIAGEEFWQIHQG